MGESLRLLCVGCCFVTFLSLPLSLSRSLFPLSVCLRSVSRLGHKTRKVTLTAEDQLLANKLVSGACSFGSARPRPRLSPSVRLFRWRADKLDNRHPTASVTSHSFVPRCWAAPKMSPRRLGSRRHGFRGRLLACVRRRCRGRWSDLHPLTLLFVILLVSRRASRSRRWRISSPF